VRRSAHLEAVVSVPFDLLLARWANFYVIAGSSSAALTGLQFVVIALSADPRAPANAEAFSLFNTPTVVHFATVLLIAGIVNAPWPSTGTISAAVGLVGAAGLTYMALTLIGMWKQKVYRMVLEDRIWHAVLPSLGYVNLLAAAILLQRQPAASLFGVAGTTVLLLFVGIHNAWDNATYLALQHLNRPATPGGRAARDENVGAPDGAAGDK
jgi:hypothetical protein